MGVLVDRVERVYQAISESIGVYIKWGMDEVWNISPVIAVGVFEMQRWAEALALHFEPDIAESVGRQFCLAPLVMHLDLESCKGDLSNHGVQHVFDFCGEHDLTPLWIGFAREQRAESQHLAKNRSCFC